MSEKPIAPQPHDPYLWLEEVEGPEALAWVEERNRECLKELQSHPLFTTLEAESLSIRNSKDRIAGPNHEGELVYNFWQDEQHERGILRRCSLAEYRDSKAEPEWELVLDIDALAAAEEEDWVYKGSSWLRPHRELALIHLSRGGADARVVREFCLKEKRFVEGGFELPEAKSQTVWSDRDTLYVATDFGPGTLTDSGYPRQVKRWRRGQSLESAELVFEGESSDVASQVSVVVSLDGQCEFVYRWINFFSRLIYQLTPSGLERLQIPEESEVRALFKGQLLFELKTDWKVEERVFSQGSLLSAPLETLLQPPRATRLNVLLEPHPQRSLEAVATTSKRLLMLTLENVSSKLYTYCFENHEWSSSQLELPEMGSMMVSSSSAFSDDFFVSYSSFLQPSTLYLVEGDRPPQALKSSPAFFNSEPFTTEQRWATSADGTEIPYFLVRGTAARRDTPTLLYGYGGFEVSLTPDYLSVLGKLWLEQGGNYAVANIRGGGEFGPRWHRAAREKNRHLAFEDFIAVAEDLIATGITSPAKLAIRGGSNGGLLTGAVFTRRPELFQGVVCQVPLLDMRRFHSLLAGASWMGEYGNPDEPEMWEYIKSYSPYHNVKPEIKYPRVLFTTSTRDDRVHPGHARKMVALMRQQGHPVLYFENTKGGHAGAADNRQRAHIDAVVYTYLLQILGATSAAPVG